MYTHTRFTVMGVLGVDPELSQTGGGTDKVRLSVSNDRGRESKWIKLTAFGKAAQNAAAYGRKGAKVFVEGHLEPRLVKLECGNTGQSRTPITSSSGLCNPDSFCQPAPGALTTVVSPSNR